MISKPQQKQKQKKRDTEREKRERREKREERKEGRERREKREKREEKKKGRERKEIRGDANSLEAKLGGPLLLFLWADTMLNVPGIIERLTAETCAWSGPGL